MYGSEAVIADLARRLKKSRAWVTQLLSEKANMTVRILAEVEYALEAEVELHAQPPSWKMAGNRPARGGWEPRVCLSHGRLAAKVTSRATGT